MSVGTMVKQIITSWFDGRVLFECEVSADIAEGLRMLAAVEIAVKQKANLSYADLSYANLSSADLSSANLSFADLSSADLSFADLRSADLRFADLRFANLSFANLRFANLRSADLSFANLRFANLRSANLSFANLSGHQIIAGTCRSDGYQFLLANLKDEHGWRIKAGCRNFTLAEAKEHWSKPRENPQLNAESLAIVEHLLSLAKIRGWEVE